MSYNPRMPVVERVGGGDDEALVSDLEQNAGTADERLPELLGEERNGHVPYPLPALNARALQERPRSLVGAFARKVHRSSLRSHSTGEPVG
jgi:hypothetical protein